MSSIMFRLLDKSNNDLRCFKNQKLNLVRLFKYTIHY